VARSLLVGSVNLESPDAVFEAVGRVLGDDVDRVPDGETGDRLGWIMSLEPRIAAVGALEASSQTWGAQEARHDFTLFRPRTGVAADQVSFGNLGYADDAIASYERFALAQRSGVLPDGVRFQISLPTAFMALLAYIDPGYREGLAPAYEQALESEIGRIVAGIPAGRLSIQWDCPCEVGIAENVAVSSAWTLADAAAELARMAAIVPGEAELGYHLCYGDPPDPESGHGKHWLEPKDAGAMVRLTNALLDEAPRPVQYVHMPVPIERDDDAFFAPLAYLCLPQETELYLGLVHFEDGVEGTQRRIDAASRHVTGFGIATECGLGRIPRAEVLPTLQIHTRVHVPVHR
jgi:hypothetical protein